MRKPSAVVKKLFANNVARPIIIAALLWILDATCWRYVFAEAWDSMGFFLLISIISYTLLLLIGCLYSDSLQGEEDESAARLRMVIVGGARYSALSGQFFSLAQKGYDLAVLFCIVYAIAAIVGTAFYVRAYRRHYQLYKKDQA